MPRESEWIYIQRLGATSDTIWSLDQITWLVAAICPLCGVLFIGGPPFFQSGHILYIVDSFESFHVLERWVVWKIGLPFTYFFLSLMVHWQYCMLGLTVDTLYLLVISPTTHILLRTPHFSYILYIQYCAVYNVSHTTSRRITRMRGMLGPKAFGAVAINDWIIIPHSVWGCYFISNQIGMEWSDSSN